MIRTRLTTVTVFLALLGLGALALPAQGVSAVTFGGGAKDSDGKACSSSFLGFPSWFNGLPRKDGTCTIDFPTGDAKTNISSFIFMIVLNVIEMALRVVGIAAVGYLIYGGFKYLTSAGSADRVTSGRKIITNALVGLIISFMSVAIVSLISVNIQGGTNAAACNAGDSTSVDPNCVGVAKVNADSAVKGILNTAYYAAGIAAVIVIIISAIFYTTSQGDASKTKRAKDGILYAIVGLVIIMMAFVITNFIIGRF
jgi:hypothetical protein